MVNSELFKQLDQSPSPESLVESTQDVCIEDCTTSNEWNRYVENHPSGTCYHLYGWRRALDAGLGYETHYLTAIRQNNIVGVFPIAIVRSFLFGTATVSLPFCSYGMPLADNPEVATLLCAAALKIANSRDSKYLEYREPTFSIEEAPKDSLYVTFRKAIPPGPAELTFLPSKRRNMVRKAIASGLSGSIEGSLDIFYELYFSNARAHGTPALPKKFFEMLQNDLGDALDILVIRDSLKTPVSCIMSFYCKGEVHAGFAGEAIEARKLGANDFKYWSLYEHAKSRECTVFDLGRSKVGTGSYEFKRLWGLTAYPIYHRYQLITAIEPPSNNPNNPKFALAIAVWPKLPQIITRWLGPKIIHGLG